MKNSQKIAATIFCVFMVVGITAAIVLFSLPFISTSQYEKGLKKDDVSGEKYSELIEVPDAIDSAAAKAILEYNDAADWDIPCDSYDYERMTPFPNCECVGEGHKVIGYDENDGILTVYAVYTMCAYNFINEHLVMIGEGVATPTIIRFDISEDGGYVYSSHIEDQNFIDNKDNAWWIFPNNMADMMYEACTDKDVWEDMCRQRDEYAAKFLKKIGREAEICTQEDIGLKTFDEFGVSESLYSNLTDVFLQYYRLGRCEALENGERYIYESTWDGDDKGNGILCFRKYRLGSSRLIENFSFEIKGDTAKKLSGASAREYMGDIIQVPTYIS